MSEKLMEHAEFARMISPEKIGFIVQLAPRRVGTLAFISFLEYRHFAPGTASATELQIALIPWEGMRWAVLVIPLVKRPLAEELLQRLGLRIADGVPTCFSASGVSRFPIDQANVYTIENIQGHFVYRNDPALGKTAEQLEDEAVERERREWQLSRKGTAV